MNKLFTYLNKTITAFLSDNDRVENVISFTTGDLLAMTVSFHLFEDVGIPIVLAILTGFLGGAVAILGKMFVKWIFKPKNDKKK